MAPNFSGANFIYLYQAPAADRTLVVSILKWADKMSLVVQNVVSRATVTEKILDAVMAS